MTDNCAKVYEGEGVTSRGKHRLKCRGNRITLNNDHSLCPMLCKALKRLRFCKHNFEETLQSTKYFTANLFLIMYKLDYSSLSTIEFLIL